jgi:hypothetical protein
MLHNKRCETEGRTWGNSNEWVWEDKTREKAWLSDDSNSGNVLGGAEEGDISNLTQIYM